MKVKKLRQYLCMSQQEFAKLLGVHNVTIGQWERKENEMNSASMKRMKAICEQNNLNFLDFLDDE